MPSGILNPGATCVIGNGVVVHVPGLFAEIDALEAAGVKARACACGGVATHACACSTRLRALRAQGVTAALHAPRRAARGGMLRALHLAR